MIHSFSLKNFYSFKDENNLSFVVHEKAPKTEGYFTSPAKLRLSKTLAVFGHNASGKTNLLKSLQFLQWFITSAFFEDPENKITVKSFVFGNQKQKPIELSVDFEVEGKIYRYFVKLMAEKVLAEELKEKGTTKFKTLFNRKWDEKNQSYNFSQKFGLTRDMEKAVRKNCSVIATAIRFNHKKSFLIANFWKKIESNVFEEGKIDDKDYHIFNAAEFFHKNKELKKRADELIAKFDIGLSGIEILKKKGLSSVGGLT